MILEVAEFRISDPADYEAAMVELVPVISASPGYLGHSIQRCVETPGRDQPEQSRQASAQHCSRGAGQGRKRPPKQETRPAQGGRAELGRAPTAQGQRPSRIDGRRLRCHPSDPRPTNVCRRYDADGQLTDEDLQ